MCTPKGLSFNHRLQVQGKSQLQAKARKEQELTLPLGPAISNDLAKGKVGGGGGMRECAQIRHPRFLPYC